MNASHYLLKLMQTYKYITSPDFFLESQVSLGANLENLNEVKVRYNNHILQRLAKSSTK